MKPIRRQYRPPTRCCRCRTTSSRLRIAVLGLLFFLGVFLAQTLRAATIESEVTSFVNQVYRDNEIQIAFGPLPHQAQGEVRVKTLGFSKVPDASGDGVCLAGIEGRNGTVTNVYVPFKVLVKRALYMAKHNIKKGEAISLADISVRESYLNGVNASYPSSVEEVIGKEATKEIPAGEVITSQLIEGAVSVQKGETVSITAENKRLTVQGKGTALEKGRMGDLIKVKSHAGKEVIGKVTGNNTVAVQF